MAESFSLDRDGVRLSGFSEGEGAAAVVLLHGLAGYGGEWAQTASWMSRRQRVVAFDARGHGDSEHSPGDLSRSAHVDDAAHVIEQLDLERPVVIGQSMGGVTAMLLAATRPDLVGGLVAVEASPMTPDEAGIEGFARWLSSWPTPFASRDAAVRFFGGPSLRGEAWADGLDEDEGGLVPRFDPDVMMGTLRQAEAQTFWDEWAAIECPALIVRGDQGSLSSEHAEAMLRLLPGSRLAEVRDAGHDLHLEQPDEWRALAEGFIGSI